MSYSWSTIRNKLEKELLCEKLRGRVKYFFTIYHDAPDQYGRFAVRVDGEEVFRANPYNEYKVDRIADAIKAAEGIPCREWDGKKRLHDTENIEAEQTAEIKAIEDGIATTWTVRYSIEEYLNLPIEKALVSENALLRMLAILDRRVGKRTLVRLAEADTPLPEWLRKFYQLRFAAEGIIVEEPCRMESVSQKEQRENGSS